MTRFDGEYYADLQIQTRRVLAACVGWLSDECRLLVEEFMAVNEFGIAIDDEYLEAVRSLLEEVTEE
jgi:hypothetical protein